MKRVSGIFKKTVPLWLALFIVLDSSLIIGVGEYYLIKRKFQKAAVELAQTTKDPGQLIQLLKQQVIPQQGYVLSVTWKDLGSQLVESGVIDKKKYEEIFTSLDDGQDHMKYLAGSWDERLKINEKNSRFMVNTLWALGLVNKNKVLDEGSMKENGDTAQFASTGGWTLGQKDAMVYYSSKRIIPLSDKQQELVKKIAETVFRPCCSNSTAFPDCNHGMAALGYIELAVYNGVGEEQIYKDLLALNSYWFPREYVEMAAYFKQKNTSWDKVDVKLALSSDYSSAQGWQKIKQSVQNIEGLNGGGGCGV
ncbi:hypothetical protein HYS93_04305 [Candidatus Daviesbacteria bacterium]|nr:hypothetical protein [Candidatus Daviesbacteria bacterium]